ncbi:hypothetical protein BH10PLA2_BH10PLA2_07300 [soil metagenome]
MSWGRFRASYGDQEVVFGSVAEVVLVRREPRAQSRWASLVHALGAQTARVPAAQGFVW